jgi:hypothetical protein
VSHSTDALLLFWMQFARGRSVRLEKIGNRCRRVWLGSDIVERHTPWWGCGLDFGIWNHVAIGGAPSRDLEQSRSTLN